MSDDLVTRVRIEELEAENARLRVKVGRLGRELNQAKYGVPDFSWSVHKAAMEELAAEVRRIRNDTLEEAAKVVEPKTPRPCDCDRCYCGNVGDAERVAQWDSDNASAAAIRAMKETDR